jgi:hypothetical protein
MKFTTRITVTGMKKSKGVIADSGMAYDSTKVYALTDLDDRKGNGMGQATVEYAFGTSEEYEKFKHLANSFPIDVEADVEIVTSGSSQKTVIAGLRPVARSAGQQAPAKA